MRRQIRTRGNEKLKMRWERGGEGRGRDHTAHVGELAEGVGVHLGAQPQEGADDRRRRRHPWCSPVLSGRTARLRGERGVDGERGRGRGECCGDACG